MIYLDVSDLPAPEPLEKILELLKTTSKDEVVCVTHRQFPCALLSILNERGYEAKIIEEKNSVQITIWHKDNLNV